MLESLQKYLSANERNIKIILGAVVVYLFLFLAYQAVKQVKINPAAPSTPEFKNELTPATSTAALPTVHIVKTGETLWSISEKYYNSGYNWTDIAKANNIASPDLIFGGTKLTIPTTNPTTNPINNPPSPSANMLQSSPASQKITGDTYTVVSGDTLWDIALRAYGDPYRWPQIAKANNLSNSDLIHRGNLLQIPR